MSRDKERDEISLVGISGKKGERGSVARAGRPGAPFRSAAGKARLGENSPVGTVQNSGAPSSLLLMDLVCLVYGYTPGAQRSVRPHYIRAEETKDASGEKHTAISFSASPASSENSHYLFGNLFDPLDRFPLNFTRHLGTPLYL